MGKESFACDDAPGDRVRVVVAGYIACRAFAFSLTSRMCSLTPPRVWKSRSQILHQRCIKSVLGSLFSSSIFFNL